MNISDQLVQATVNYLGTKPYQEVAQLIGAFQVEINKENERLQKEKADKEKPVKEEIKK